MNKSQKRLRNGLQFTITNDHFRILKNTYSGTQKKKKLKKPTPKNPPKQNKTQNKLNKHTARKENLLAHHTISFEFPYNSNHSKRDFL